MSNRHLSRIIELQTLYEWDFRPEADIRDLVSRNVENFNEPIDEAFIDRAVSGVIEKESALFVANESTFRDQFAIDVRTLCEAVGINAAKKTVDLKDLKTGKVTTESYDKLVLSPGAAPTATGSSVTLSSLP